MQPTERLARRSGLVPRLPRNVWLLSAASFLRDVASETLVHLVPLYLTNVLAARTVVVGLIDGVAETTASLMKLVSGSLSDRAPRRKPFVVAGYGLAALATPLYFVAASWPVVFAARFVDRLGKGLRTAPRDALLADALDPRTRGMGFGLHRAADSAGAFVGLLTAIGIVWTLQGDQARLTADTFNAAVWFALIPSVLAVAVIAWGVREGGRGQAQSHSSSPNSLPSTAEESVGDDTGFVRTEKLNEDPDVVQNDHLIQNDHRIPEAGHADRQAEPAAGLRSLGRPYWGLLAAVVIFAVGNSSDAFLLLRAQAAGMSLVQVLTAMALFNLVYTLLSTPAGSLSDRLPRRRIVLGGWLLYAVVYAGFGVAGPGTLWALFAIYGAYYAFTEGVLKAVIADVAPPASRGAAFGMYHAAVGLAALPASLIAGLLWQGIGDWQGLGPAAPFWFGAVLALVAAVVLVWSGRQPGPASTAA